MIDVSASEERWLQGRAVVPGIAFGSLYVLPEFSKSSLEKSEPVPVSIEHEISRFSVALAESQTELQMLRNRLNGEGFCQEADLVDTHLLLTSDPELVLAVKDHIRERRVRADSAVKGVMEQLRARFHTIEHSFFRQRFEDIEGVCFRLLGLLSADETPAVSIPPQAVLFAKTVTAPVVVEVSNNGLGAIVTTNGGAMSHTAIVAKARGIPYVTNIQSSSFHEHRSGNSVIVDGLAGLVIVCPTKETIRKYKILKKSHETSFQRTIGCIGGRTKDGVHVRLFGNVSGSKDTGQLDQFGLEGVGLYRTEYQLLDRRRFPTEDEQAETYSEMVSAAQGKPVVIRVFDFGSDKAWDEVSGTLPEINRGGRTVGLLLNHKKIFLSQLRAIIRASAHGPVSILFPMISSLEEIDRCLELFHEACAMASLPPPRVGAMIELPSLALRTRELAAKVDFLSVGTNDLTQYVLAVDRSNTASFDPLLSFHPGLLRILHYIAVESIAAHRPLCLCGEMATDPLLIPFLIGIGIKELSIAPRMAPMVRHVIQAFTVEETRSIAATVLSASSVHEIYSFLQTQYCSTHGS